MPRRRLRGLGGALLAALTLHAAAWVAAGPIAGPRPAGSATPAATMLTRFIALPPVPTLPAPSAADATPVAAAPATPTLAAPLPSAAAETPSDVPPAAPQQTAAAPPPALAAMPEATLPPPAPTVPSPASPGPDDAAGNGLEWLPRSLLSVAPRPLRPVDIPFPAEVPGVLKLRTELSLFIDETGVVQRVRVDGDRLPPALEEAARDAFLNARFAPGQRDGQRVRSWIRVEVAFDSESQVDPAPAR